MDEINTVHMDWGRQHEDSARSFLEFDKDVKTVRSPFVFKDDSFRIGCSPDGFIVGEPIPYEIKCPWNSANYIKFLVADEVKSEWKWQQQFNLWVLGAEEMYFCQFDPRMKKTPLKVMRTEKDPEKHAKFDELIPAFIEDMDKMLAKVGIPFGDQWHRLAEDKKKEPHPATPPPHAQGN